MNTQKFKKYCLIGIRWAARIYGALLAALILTIAIGEGPPNPFTQPLPVAIGLFGMLAMLIGCIVGWKWQGLGAILVIGGIMTFHVIEKRLWLMGAFPLFDLAGILFLFCWCLGRPQRNGKIKDA
ncbi:MAG: hypothetical protein ABIG61_04895 [Planctomycetota bacterium]